MKSVQNKKRTAKYTDMIVFLLSAFILTAAFSNHPYMSAVLSRMYIAAAMAAGLDLCAGVAGQLSLGQGAFMAFGAYSAAITVMNVQTPFAAVLGIVLGAVIALVFAVMIGTPILKLTGDYLGMATLGIMEITRISLENMKSLGASGGISGIYKFSDSLVCFIFLTVSAVLCIYLTKSDFGLFCKALGNDEKAASASGINTRFLKVIAFSVCCVICGVAGGLYAGLTGFISPEDFSFTRSIDIVAAVVLGGRGTIIGPIIAAMVLEATSAIFQGFGSFRMIIYGLVLVIAGILRYKNKTRKS